MPPFGRPKNCSYHFVIACMLLCAFTLVATNVLAASSDTGTSLNLLLKTKLNKDWFLLSRSNIASRNNNGEIFFGYSGASLGYQLNDIWSIRAGYRHAGIKLQGTWLREDRPFIEAYVADVHQGFRLSNRSRIEWRMFNYRKDDIRLRNEVTVEAPWRLTSLGLQPYLEEEFFFGTNEDRLEANWLGAGLTWRPAKGVKLKVGYRWNHFRVGDDWRNRDILVLGLNLFY